MWYYVVYICRIYLPLDPKPLDPQRGQIAFAFDKCDAFIGAAVRGIYAACCALGKLCSLHFMFRQRKSKYVNTLPHTHTRWGLHPSLGQTSGTAAVCVCVRHQGQFIVYLKLWTCETTSCKRWARGGECWAGVTPRCLVNSTNSTQMRKCDKIYAKVININVVLSRK